MPNGSDEIVEVTWLTVDCPRCHSPAGEVCDSQKNTPHWARMQLAAERFFELNAEPIRELELRARR